MSQIPPNNPDVLILDDAELIQGETAAAVGQSHLQQSQTLESIGQLAAGIAHEINTPTQYVGDNLRFLQAQFGNLIKVIEFYASQMDEHAPARSWIERNAEIQSTLKSLDFAFLQVELPLAISQSLEGVERVASIVRAMKEFSHPASENKEPCDINRSICSTIEVCRNRWKYVAELETDLASDLPMIPCLVAEFNQVVLNLLVNASDAIAEAVEPESGGKGLIKISTRRRGDWVEIDIGDNGNGIAPAIHHRIFEQFFTTKPLGKGTGQGLALSRNVIVNKLGGKLTFQSTRGIGTTFTICLPVNQSVSREPEAA